MRLASPPRSGRRAARGGCASLDDFLPPQGVDRRAVVAELLQDLVGVLAELGRRDGDARRRARELHRLVDDADLAELRALHAGGGADVLHLGIVEHLVDRVDRPAGNLRLREYLGPLPGSPRRERLVDLGVERDAVLRAVLLALEILALEQVGPPYALAHPAPHLLAG